METDKPYIHGEISKKIKNRSYFSDAINWYAEKFLRPLIERNLMLFICISCVAGFIFTLINLYNVFPITREIPFTVTIKDPINTYTELNNITGSHDSAYVSVAKYLLWDYVRTRESYEYSHFIGNNLKIIQRKVKNTSTKNVYRDYLSLISKSNPQNPLSKYGKDASKNVQLIKTKILNIDETGGEALINYNVFIIKKAQENEQYKEEVIVRFKMPDIERLPTSATSLRFLVTNYEISRRT